jgi:putative hydrolase of the HAD superfamily
MAGVKGLIFDLFFTLINPMREDLARDSEYAILGMERGEFERRNGIDYSVRGGGQIRDPYEMMRHILRGLDLSEDLLRRTTDARLERIRRALYSVEPKNLDVLKKLRERGFKTALLSNADVADIYHWQGSPLSAAFDTVIFSCEAGLLKPDPEIFRLALDSLGLPAAQVLYAGDGGHNELRGAREAGMTTVLTTEYITRAWPERIPTLKNDADYHIEHLEEIWGIINGEKVKGS